MKHGNRSSPNNPGWLDGVWWNSLEVHIPGKLCGDERNL